MKKIITFLLFSLLVTFTVTAQWTKHQFSDNSGGYIAASVEGNSIMGSYVDTAGVMLFIETHENKLVTSIKILNQGVYCVISSETVNYSVFVEVNNGDYVHFKLRKLRILRRLRGKRFKLCRLLGRQFILELDGDIAKLARDNDNLKFYIKEITKKNVPTYVFNVNCEEVEILLKNL